MSVIQTIGVGVAISVLASSFAVFVKFGSVQEAVNSNTGDVATLKEFRHRATDLLKTGEVRDEALRARVHELEVELQKMRSTVICLLAHQEDEDRGNATLKCITEGVNKR